MYTPKIKIYTALMTQSGTSIPIAQVLHNSIGDIVWTRVGAGNYRGTLTTTPATFTENKVIGLTGQVGYGEINVSVEPLTVNSVALYAINAGVMEDDILFNTPIEIRVYR